MQLRALFSCFALVLALPFHAFADDAREPAQAPEGSDSVSQSSVADVRKNWAVGFLLGPDRTAKFDDVTVTNSSGTRVGDVEFDIASAVGILLEYRNMQANSWGFQGGLAYEFKSKVDSVTVKGANGSVSVATSDKFSQVVLYGNAVYQWEQFYLPFGLNLAVPKFENEGGADVGGGLGAQFGVGVQINELFGIELVGQSTALKIKASDSGSTIDYDTGYVSSLRLQGKFAF